jgi:hypothetical protein
MLVSAGQIYNHSSVNVKPELRREKGTEINATFRNDQVSTHFPVFRHVSSRISIIDLHR